jgi:hypothetical protein
MNTNRALEFLQAIYMDDELPLLTRVRVAIACLPFETPKLAIVAQVSDQDFATLLDQRIARYEKMKLIEANSAKIIDAQPINGKPQAKPQIETKPPLARTPDRRFRRF